MVAQTELSSKWNYYAIDDNIPTMALRLLSTDKINCLLELFSWEEKEQILNWAEQEVGDGELNDKVHLLLVRKKRQQQQLLLDATWSNHNLLIPIPHNNNNNIIIIILA